jgi:hypothetical protein
MNAQKPDEAKAAASLGEYLGSAKESLDVFKWIWKEMTTPESRRKIKFLLCFLCTVIFLQSLQPIFVSFIFKGLETHDKDLVIAALATFLGCLFTQKIFDRLHENAREWVLSLHWGRLDRRITEMLLEKSIGQHIQEAKRLAVSNIDKGKYKALDMQGMLLFDGIGTFVQLTLAYGALCILNWTAGLIMGVVISIYIGWSLFLNLRVNQACTPTDKAMRALNRHRVERWERDVRDLR